MVPFGVLALVVGVVVVFVGATVQGSIGFGINMLSAPVIAVVAPGALPGSVVIVAFPLCVMAAVRERHALDRACLPWLLLGVLPGTFVGLAIVAVANAHLIALIVGIVTLIGVAVSVRGWHVQASRTNSFVAGTLANVFGTASGTSGAPVALLFQRHGGPASRSTLGAFFSASASTSIIGYALIGDLTVSQVEYASLLIPAMVCGLVLSSRIRHHVDGRWLRPAVLALTAVAGAAAISRSFL